MARQRKSIPLSVRLPHDLASWVESYVLETGMSKTAVLEEAVMYYKRAQQRRLNDKKRDLLNALRNS